MNDFRTWEAWRDQHQPFELQWWKDNLDNYRDDAAFEEQWREAKEFIRPQGLILDIGCGPRPPFKPCFVIEPLALEYQKITPPAWWRGVAVYAQAAEIPIDDLLKLRFNTIVCWNCIDHTIGWKQMLDSMVAYGDVATRYALATDFWEPFLGHPGFDRYEFMAEIEARFEIVYKREPLGRQLALLMRKRNGRVP